MKKQRRSISRKVVPALAAVACIALTSFPAKAASGNEAAYAAVFDSTFYADHNPDLQIAFGNNRDLLLNHFITHGMAEGRQGNEEFNVQYYKGKYNDLQAAFGENLPDYYLHYIALGKTEGRVGNGAAEEIPDAQVAVPVNKNTMEINYDYDYSYDFNYDDLFSYLFQNTGTVSFSGDTSGYAQEVIKLVNEIRAENGLGSLTSTPELMRTAQIRAEETATLFSHTRPDGSTCYTAFQENGVSNKTVGENIASGQMSPEEVMQSWMGSTIHRDNILSPKFKHIGVGCYQSGSGYGIYWTQCFTD